MVFFLKLAGSILFPPVLLGGFYIVSPNEEAVIVNFGKYKGTMKKPGLHWTHPIGTTISKVSTKDDTIDLPKSKVLDSDSKPIDISAVVTYKITNSYDATFKVNNVNSFLHDQAKTILKAVCSKYPYEGNANSTISLKGESDEVTKELVKTLQKAVDIAGIEVKSVRFNDLSYSQEIASDMLMKQKAQSVLDAKETIVNGVTELASDAVRKFEKNNMPLTPSAKEAIIVNALSLSFSNDVQPTMPLYSNTARDR